jgi:hypothetical protein
MSDQAASSATSQQQTASAGNDAGQPKTVSIDEFTRVQDRAYKMEAVAKDFEKKFTELEGKIKGIDLDEARRLKEENEKLQEERAKNNPEEREKLYASREAKLRKELGDQLDSLTKSHAEKDSIIKELRVTDRAMAEVGPLFRPNCHRFVKDEIRKYMDFQDDQIVVKDDKGVVLYSKVTPGALMTVKEWAEEFGKQYPEFMNATAVGGARQPTGTKQTTTGSSAGGATSVPANFSSMTKAEQTAFFKANPDALANFEKTFKYG